MAVRVAIAGCGFGGMAAAFEIRRLLGKKAIITAIDKAGRFDYHASLPELVSGKVKEQDITIPYREAFSKEGIKFVQAKITGVEIGKKALLTSKGKVKYDYLVIALGSQTEFYGVPGARENSFEFKSHADALAIRSHVMELFSSCPTDKRDTGHSRIAIVGGGLTGVELACDLRDLLDDVCSRCSIPHDKRQLVLIGRGKHLNPGFSDEVSAFTEKYLRARGISLVLGDAAAAVEKDAVVLKSGKKIVAKTIIWCAGIRPSALSEQFGSENYNDRCGLVLNRYLQSIADPHVFAVGDCGYCSAYEVQPTLTAMRAIEQANFVSHNLYCEADGKQHHKMPYSPRIFPALISLGSGMGVLSFNGLWASGRHIAWLKKLSQRLHMLRFRNNWPALEYFDELFLSFIEFAYFDKVRKK